MNDEYKDKMMAYLDGELSDEQKSEFERYVETHPEAKEELEQFRKLKDITDKVSLHEPDDKLWADYWCGVYNRIERCLGWVLFSVAAIILLSYGGFKLIEEIINEPGIQLIVKVALVMLIVGLAILIVSLVREKLYFEKRQRYKDIKR